MIKNLEIVYPPFDLEVPRDEMGGVHKLQISIDDFRFEFSEDPPGCLPVGRKSFLGVALDFSFFSIGFSKSYQFVMFTQV